MQSSRKVRSFLDFTNDMGTPTDLKVLPDGTPDFVMKSGTVGPVNLFAFESCGVHLQTQRNRDSDGLLFHIALSGSGVIHQHDRTAVQAPGDMTVVDRIFPAETVNHNRRRSLYVDCPRAPLEDLLGSARLYSALTIEGTSPSAALARSFLQGLERLQGDLDGAAMRRMAGIGLDLVVACIAERMERDPPYPVQGTAILQRAKAYVEDHLHDASLDPRSLAAAMGVSLRRLQQLFHERGFQVSEWIWSRRLVRATRLLTELDAHRTPIGAVAYACGFASQAHFTARFRDRFGITPSEYRHEAQTAPPKRRP